MTFHPVSRPHCAAKPGIFTDMVKLPSVLTDLRNDLGSLPPEAAELLADDHFATALEAAARDAGRTPVEVTKEAIGYLREMAASQSDSLGRRWRQLGDWFLRAYDVWVDEDQIAALRELDRSYSLGLAFSHRSYLDGFVLPNVLSSRRFSPTYTFGGANLDLPGIGSVASRTGVILIRRKSTDIPVYRLTLRHYISHMVRSKRNMAWSIEGGRTRTGKLRPPVHGILKYLTDAVEESNSPDVMMVPVSIVYDQLHELSKMTAEARGDQKTPENLRWLVGFARQQRSRLGRAYLSVGEPFSLRDRFHELIGQGLTAPQAIERIALDVSHRLNRATPVTVTAIVCLAMLGADRALTLPEVLDTVEPLADYIGKRKWPVAGAANLRDRATIRRSLQELVASGVFVTYDQGTEPVWGIGPDQHLVAAFYRNTAIHILVERAIGEVTMLAAAESGEKGDATEIAWTEAKRLRDLLKFEFFFPGRNEFEAELRTELGILAPSANDGFDAKEAGEILANVRPYLAQLILRPFLDAYHVLADRLAAHGDAPVNADDLLTESLHVGQQWQLQRKVANAESVSLELYKTALLLATHRGLLNDDEGVGVRRREFAQEIAETIRRIEVIAAMKDKA